MGETFVVFTVQNTTVKVSPLNKRIFSSTNVSVFLLLPEVASAASERSYTSSLVTVVVD